MISRALLFLLPVACFGALSGGYNYNRCNTTYGPANWPGACQAQTSGTPINLCGAVAFPSGAPTPTVTGYNVARTVNISSDGSSLTVTVLDNNPTVVVGNLAYLVGRGATNNSVHTWVLQQMHIHWGRTGLTNEGSEHFLQGKQYAAEAHFVHYNARFASFSAAVGSGANDALLVVGIFLEAGSSDVATIVAMANAVPTVTPTNAPLSPQVTFSDLYTGSGTYYSYGGSLTTPTCLEIVTWIVMTDTKPITVATLNKIWALTIYPPSTTAESIGKYGNYRPLQSLSGRTLYNSNGATAACGTVTQPTFVCSTSGASMLSPALSLQAGILLMSLMAFWH